VVVIVYLMKNYNRFRSQWIQKSLICRSPKRMKS
jgi:hypothetical protein